MRRTEVLQGLGGIKFEEINERWQQRRLSQAEAAEILGMSERTFRRWRDRYRADGLEGLADGRLGKASARRVPIDQVQAVLTLYRERYCGFAAKHFHDKLRQHMGSSSATRGPGSGCRPLAWSPRRRAVRRTARSARAARSSECCCIRTARAIAGCRRSSSSST
jgi:transposase